MGKNVKHLERAVSKGVSRVTDNVPKILKRSSIRGGEILSNLTAGVSYPVAKQSKKIGKGLKKAERNLVKRVNRVTEKVLRRKRSRHDVSVAFDKKRYLKIIRKIYREENEHVRLIRRFIGTYYDVLVDPRHVGSDYELLSETFSALAKIAAFHHNFAYALKETTEDFEKPRMGPALIEFFVDRKLEFQEEYRKLFDTLLQESHSAIKRASHQDPNLLQFLIDAKDKDKDKHNCNDFLMKPKERIETLKADLYDAGEMLDSGPGFIQYKGRGHPDIEPVQNAYDTVCEVADVAFKSGVFFRSKLESLKRVWKT